MRTFQTILILMCFQTKDGNAWDGNVPTNYKIKTSKNDDADDDPSNNPNDTYYLVKGAPIASGGALQILDGGAKIVVQDGDRLWVQSDTLNSVDAWISTVKAISN